MLKFLFYGWPDLQTWTVDTGKSHRLTPKYLINLGMMVSISEYSIAIALATHFEKSYNVTLIEESTGIIELKN